MIRFPFIAALSLASSVAIAQPAPSDPPTEPVPTAPEPPPQPQPPQPPVLTRVETPAPQPAVETPPDPIRPEGFSIGIGVGYRFPTSLTTPNAASVRFRLPSGMTFEPNLVIATSSNSVDVGMTQESSSTEVGVGALARFPVIQRRRTELQLLASFGVDRLSTDPNDTNPDDKSEVTTTTLGYGLAVGFWAWSNLQISLSATNPLVSYVHKREEMGFGFVSVTNTTTFGLIFDPTVTLMVHLYN